MIVEIDPRYLRPTEVGHLQADISRAKAKLGWEPKVTFNELVKIMVDADMKLIDITPSSEGENILLEKGIDWTKNKITVS